MSGISDKAIKTNYAENKYRYSGKELQHQEFSDGSGLEEYDYGARFQDPQLGVWHNIDPMAEKYPAWSPYVYCKDNPISFFDFEEGDPTPAQYTAFFLNYAVPLYEEAKKRGASTLGALTLVSQVALESAFVTNPATVNHNNPYSLMSNGGPINFPGPVTATNAFFGNLDKNWPDAMKTLSQSSFSGDDLDSAYFTGKHYVNGKEYMLQDKTNNYDYGDKIVGINSSLAKRFITALDGAIGEENKTIEWIIKPSLKISQKS